MRKLYCKFYPLWTAGLMTPGSLDCLIYSSELFYSSAPENRAVVSLYEYNGCHVGLSPQECGAVWVCAIDQVLWTGRNVKSTLKMEAEISFKILILAHYTTVSHPRTVLYNTRITTGKQRNLGIIFRVIKF
jgi:hypothetical protein